MRTTLAAGRAPLLVFAGERRSVRAVKLDVTWLSGRLAGKTLHAALRAAGIAPERCVFVNVLHDDPRDGQPCDIALLALRSLASAGATIFALGRRVQAALRRARIAHVPLTHPAARGAIRTRAAYQQHVRDALAAAGVLPGGERAAGGAPRLRRRPAARRPRVQRRRPRPAGGKGA